MHGSLTDFLYDWNIQVARVYLIQLITRFYQNRFEFVYSIIYI